MAFVDEAARSWATSLLEEAGIEVGGDRPWDMEVHDERLYRRVALQGSLGLGEAYVEGWWDSRQLDAFFARVQRADLGRRVRFSWPYLVRRAQAWLLNLQRLAPFEIGEHHYDLGNDLYRRMLDDRMTYSCGYWQQAKDLNEAQEAKLDLVCRKLGLEPGMRLLDIGCGWGSLLGFAAERYDVEAVGLTVSREQVAHVRQRYPHLPVEVRLQDYRDLGGGETFDRVASVGMFEHVGPKNHRTFFEVAHRALDEGGLLLLHTIGRNESQGVTDPWVSKYIFPNSALPSPGQICQAIEGLFVAEDWHNFGQDYDPTLMAWHENFAEAWPELRGERTSEFRRLWSYYLLSSAGTFRARRNQLWQVVLAKDRGVDGGYEPVR